MYKCFKPSVWRRTSLWLLLSNLTYSPLHEFHHEGFSLLRLCRYALTSSLGLSPERAHGDTCLYQQSGLSDTLLSSCRVTLDGASTLGVTTFSIPETSIGVGVSMEDTTYRTLLQHGDQSSRLHVSSPVRGSTPRQNMHKYPPFASNTLLLWQSFPSVSVGVATEGPKLKTE